MSISADESVELYGKINNLLHAERDFVVADIIEDLNWVNKGLERLRDQTTQFILYREDSEDYVVQMGWGEDCSPKLVRLQ